MFGKARLLEIDRQPPLLGPALSPIVKMQKSGIPSPSRQLRRWSGPTSASAMSAQPGHDWPRRRVAKWAGSNVPHPGLLSCSYGYSNLQTWFALVRCTRWFARRLGRNVEPRQIRRVSVPLADWDRPANH